MTVALVQLVGSLLAILLLARLAGLLGLGGDVRLRDTDEACALAQATVCGFEPVAVALDRAGIGAVLRDNQGRIMVLKRHGARFAGRLLDSYEGTRLDRHFLTLSTDDPGFGSVTLDLGSDAQAWASSLRRLEG
ncbi:MAG: hypothetical protein RLZZ136_1780 [Pseudomonadota bacterium]|jgi:hypothetical protein